MSIPKYVRLFPNTTKVDPMLMLAVNKLVSFNKGFQFEGVSAINNDYTNGFTIFDGVDKVGTIEFGNHQTKADANGNCAPAFAVGSPRVQKERGNRTKVITGDLGAAVRHAKKLLAKPDVAPQADSIVENLHSRMQRVLSDIDYRLRNALSIDTNQFAHWLASNLVEDDGPLMGREKLKLSDIPTAIFSVGTDIFGYKHRFEVLEQMLIDSYQCLADGRGVFVKRLRGDGIRVFEFEQRAPNDPVPEGKAVTTYHVGYSAPKSVSFTGLSNSRIHCNVTMTDYPSIDAAPNWIKEKISTLTLAECDHAIPNIGVKVQGDKTVDMFFIYRKQFLEDEANENTAAV